jgi:hypothetical protein
MAKEPFWTLNGVYTHNAIDGMRVIINFFRENVEKGEKLSDDNLNTAYRIWQMQDMDNRRDANQNSFKLFCWDALVGNALQRLQGGAVLQNQVDALRTLHGLEQVYN